MRTNTSASAALVVTAASLLLSGCFGLIQNLTPDGLCGGRDYNRYYDFCRKWSSATNAYYRKDWDATIKLAREAKALKEYEALDQLIADASAAKADGDDGPYNMRLSYCPRQVSLDGPNDWFQLLRCPAETAYRYNSSSGKERSLNVVRSYMRRDLNDPDHDELLRASYVWMCAEQLKLGKKDYPLRTLGCAWHADALDWDRLRSEIVGISPAERSKVETSGRNAAEYVRQRADAAYPEGSRDRALFYDLPTKVLAEYTAFQQTWEAPLNTIRRFRKAVLAGDTARCAPPLQARLAEHMEGTRGHLKALRARLVEGVGLQLVEALAQCHYFNDREVKAAALMTSIARLSAPADYPTRLYLAQRLAIQADRDKARKMPHLVGKTLTTARLDDLRPPEVPLPKVFRQWQRQQRGITRRGRRVQGVVSAIKRTRTGHRLSFKKSKVPRVDEKCRETRTIERISSDGTIIYRLKCRVVRRWTEMVGPPPLEVDDVTGVKLGNYVEIIVPREGPGTVYLAAKSAKENARVYRLAEVISR